MGVFDKAKHQAQQWTGKAKEAAGNATGNDELKNAGKRDQVEGQVKETGQDVKDKAAGAVQDVQDKFKGSGESESSGS
ncbi:MULTISPECIES: CsbD family protein [unclassified Saccharopolyspora]|uniref:CsbD family protein n=1 Tax=unclassified Saccharopolyspora TaxID=2646250 RepID=UPI001CD6D79A|nr:MULTISPECIES: CsbD family protein [unclassified Saccharopolyspora]MCA1188722.1 CsbD family protein [Saccharopolyspora sp. 6T]MCA1192085.1 CsbD family protein [Saccharopolyspora sp. 6V]MCA1226113.1 CsbD family protein [Saccharopolyspora sp. 6M]MCA1280246.1 CsbD family protein [Saccharopolyspora sp. 7B]